MRTRIEIEKLIDDFFHNRIPAGHLVEAIGHMEEESGKPDIEQLMRQHWDEAHSDQMPDEKEFTVFLHNIHHRINLVEEDKKRTMRPKGKSARVVGIITKIAAVLSIPLLVTTLFFHSQQNETRLASESQSLREVYTPMAARTKLLLPDSTVVWLNSGSTLSFPGTFAGNTREVTLSGEGYFDVFSNPDQAFVVNTDKISITATGTSFNVMAYPDDYKTTTTLVSGGVNVEERGTGLKFNLNPSYQFVMHNSTNKTCISQVDTRFFTSWKDGRLIFRNEPFELVARKLERWFNCKIYLMDPQMREFRFTGNIEMETLRELLELINITTPVKSNYNQETREIWLESR